ncbi:hypothetical protein L7F22_054549 [Adiantum nelumboides]|nr:hypothetical protein [Adiantum nelumboides]
MKAPATAGWLEPRCQRAYKLGKQKCSYNQVELLVKDMHGSDSELQVSEAIETAIGAEIDDFLKESCLKFNVRFVNNDRMHLYIYVVYASPYCSTSRGESKHTTRYYWVPVTRSKCRKGCRGPVIRGLQRFGKMSRRVGNMNSLQSFAEQEGQEHVVNAVQISSNGNSSFAVGDTWKEPRHLYIAIDEASTHVCPRPQTCKFRLLVAAYDDQNQLVGSAVSGCIRVLANNDAPLGAAAFKLLCPIEGIEKSANRLPIETLPAGTRISPDKQYGRFPLQEMSQFRFNPSSNIDKVTGIGTVTILWSEVHTVIDKQLCFAKSPSSSCCSDETVVNKDNSSLENLCQRVFSACSCKQQGVIALRKFATILGASRQLLMDIFSILTIVKVVEEQGKEKYLWLGSDHIEDALQELMVNKKQSNLSTCIDSKAGVVMDCEFPSISELGKSFCLLFLLNKYTDITWEFAVDTLLSEAKGSAREGIRTSLWKISVILSALHLIVSKRGPVFKWSGREGVATHLNSLVHLRLVQRYQEVSFCPNKKASYCLNKRRKIHLEKVDGDCIADDRHNFSNVCNQLITDHNPDQHATKNVNWQFDPLTSLKSIYTPQQVITMQQHNPGFLLNFVRYYRQLYHKYGRNFDALVHLPFPLRPCYSSFCLFKNLAAKATSCTTESHSGPTGMLQWNANFTSPGSFS